MSRSLCHNIHGIFPGWNIFSGGLVRGRVDGCGAGIPGDGKTLVACPGGIYGTWNPGLCLQIPACYPYQVGEKGLMKEWIN